MMHRLLRLICRGFISMRGTAELGEMDRIAGSSMAGLLLAQEGARLDYLGTKERFCRKPTARHLAHLMEALLRLQSTNALVQSLINQHMLETLLDKQRHLGLAINRGNMRDCA